MAILTQYIGGCIIMINRIKKYIASIVAGVMLFVHTVNAFAASDIQDEEVINYEVNSDELDNIVDELDEELTRDVLKENFNNLSEEAKQVFLNEIKYDEELLNFHKEIAIGTLRNIWKQAGWI